MATSNSRSISSDGRYTPFNSVASNIVSGDTNNKRDIFVRDLKTNTTTRVNVSSTGVQADDDSFLNTISDTGRYIVYQSKASSLEGGQSYGLYNSYVYDLKTGQNVHLPYIGNPNFFTPAEISDDGRFVLATAMPDGMTDTNNAAVQQPRVVLYDKTTASYTRIALPVSGSEEQGPQESPPANCSGSFVVFKSTNTNLVVTDGNGSQSDIFLADLRKGIKLTNLTQSFNGSSSDPRISCKGRYITFKSNATNIVDSPSPVTPISGENYYRYDRINGSFSFVKQWSDGGIMYNANVRHVTDSGKVIYFATSQASNITFSFYYIRDENSLTTERVTDHLNNDWLRSTQYGVTIYGMDADGKIFATQSNRSDLITSDTNNADDVFVSKLN